MSIYKNVPNNIWTGRIDSETDCSAFRFHQMINTINVMEDVPTATDKIAVAFIGNESDLGIEINKGRVGASQAPNAIRKKIASLPFPWKNGVSISDFGNLSTGDSSLSQAQEDLATLVTQAKDNGYFPIVLGGGHDTALGTFKGLYNSLKSQNKKIGIINFDAHFDNRPYRDSGPSSGTMFRQIYDLSVEEKFEYKYLVLGVQKHGNTQSLFDYADSTGTEYIFAKEFQDSNNKQAITDQVDKFINSVDYVYVTFDMDVISVANAPGVSAQQPLGLLPSDLMPNLLQIVRSGKMVGMDIVEVSPPNDINDQTSALASNLIYYVIDELAK